MKQIRPIISIAIAFLFASCGQGSEGTGNSNPNSGNPLNPIAQQSVRGDIERANFAVLTASNYIRDKRWGEALTSLEGARNDINSALTKRAAGDRLLHLRPMLEELQRAINQTVEAVQNRSPEAESLITQLQVHANSVRSQAQTSDSSAQPEQPKQ